MINQFYKSTTQNMKKQQLLLPLPSVHQDLINQRSQLENLNEVEQFSSRHPMSQTVTTRARVPQLMKISKIAKIAKNKGNNYLRTEPNPPYLNIWTERSHYASPNHQQNFQMTKFGLNTLNTFTERNTKSLGRSKFRFKTENAQYPNRGIKMRSPIHSAGNRFLLKSSSRLRGKSKKSRGLFMTRLNTDGTTKTNSFRTYKNKAFNPKSTVFIKLSAVSDTPNAQKRNQKQNKTNVPNKDSGSKQLQKKIQIHKIPSYSVNSDNKEPSDSLLYSKSKKNAYLQKKPSIMVEDVPSNSNSLNKLWNLSNSNLNSRNNSPRKLTESSKKIVNFAADTKGQMNQLKQSLLMPVAETENTPEHVELTFPSYKSVTKSINNLSKLKKSQSYQNLAIHLQKNKEKTKTAHWVKKEYFTALKTSKIEMSYLSRKNKQKKVKKLEINKVDPEHPKDKFEATFKRDRYASLDHRTKMNLSKIFFDNIKKKGFFDDSQKQTLEQKLKRKEKPKQMGSYIKGHKAMMKHKLKSTYENNKKETESRKQSLDQRLLNFKNGLAYQPEWKHEIQAHNNWASKVITQKAVHPELTNRILKEKILENESGVKTDQRRKRIEDECPIKMKFSRAITKVNPKYLDLRSWGKYQSQILDQNFQNRFNFSKNLGVIMKIQRLKNRFKSKFKRDKIKKETEVRSRFYDLEHKKNLQDKRTMKMMARLVINFLRVLKKIKVKLSDLLKWPVFPTEPYAIEGCKKFFMYVKVGNVDKVKSMLLRNRYYIFQIDSVSLTPLNFKFHYIHINIIGEKDIPSQSCDEIQLRNGGAPAEIFPGHQRHRFHGENCNELRS